MELWQGLLIYFLWIAFCGQSARLLAMLCAGRWMERD
jgi:hypothetical protein